ncbi:hypothetical protein Dimus_005802 [Dionaea muscipula]
MYETACKEFYKNLTVSISQKKEVARSCVHGVNIELDGMILAAILEIPGNHGICEYFKEVWEDTQYFEETATVEGKPKEKEAITDDTGSGDKFYDAEEGETPATEVVPAAAVMTVEQTKEKNIGTRVDPSGHLLDFDILHLQAEFARALQANTRFQELYQKMHQPHQNHSNHLDLT